MHRLKSRGVYKLQRLIIPQEVIFMRVIYKNDGNMTKYLLSTGESTTRVEYYILDLFKLNLAILPGDIPRSKIGFNFILTDTKNQDISTEVSNRVNSLVSKIKDHFSAGIYINLDSVELIDQERVRVTITVNEVSDNIEIEL